MRFQHLSMLLVVLVSLRCGSADPNPNDAADVPVLVMVTDSTGAPVRAVPASVTAYRRSRVDQLAYSFPTSVDGTLHVIDTLARQSGPVDSFIVAVTPYQGDCNPFPAQVRSVQRGRPLVTSVRVALEVQLTAPLATVQPGEFCGVGIGPQPPPSHVGLVFSVRLFIDSIADSIRGVWKIDFQSTLASPMGSFAGPVRTDSLILDLVPSFIHPPPDCTPRFRLAGQLGPAGTTQLVHLHDQNDCGWGHPSKETPFRLISFDNAYFPG